MNESKTHSGILEKALLSMMIQFDMFGVSVGLIEEKYFYFDDNKAVYLAIKELYDKLAPINHRTVILHLEEKNITLKAGDSLWYILSCDNFVTNPSSFTYECYLLKKFWQRRELVRLTNSGIEAGEEEGMVIRKLTDELATLQGFEVAKEWYSMDELIFGLLKHQTEIKTGEKKFVTTGFRQVNRLNGGYAGGNFIILAARPSVGKSAVMGKKALAMARMGLRVGIISLEMNNNEIAGRLAALETSFDFATIYRNLFIDEQQQADFYNEVVKNCVDLPIFVSDKTKVNGAAIRAKAKKLRYQHGCDVLFLDYLQLVDSTGTNKQYNREQEVSTLSRDLKMLAMEMDIPLIALCQLNRESTKRHGKNRYPQLSDLRESGAIEQNADIVAMLHRDWLLGGDCVVGDTGFTTEFEADLLYVKWRNGALAHLKLDFNPQKMQFSEQSLGHFAPQEQNQDDNPF